MRFVLADKCPTVRLGIKELLQLVGGLKVIGEADTAEQVLHLTAELHPDMVILDPCFDDSPSGVRIEAEICRGLKSLPGSPCVIVYAAHNSPADVLALAQAGVDHYVHKSTDRESLRRSWERIWSGEPVWIVGADHESAALRLKSTLRTVRLTLRQQEILSLLLRRYSDAEIAKKLYISLQTVKNHNVNIFRRLGVEGRQELYDKFLT